MSHTSRHKSMCTNLDLIQKTAERVGAEFLGEIKRYGAKGPGVKLNRWYHPCLFSADGEVLYDSDDTRQIGELHKFKQQYQVVAAETAFPRARITQTALDNGELELTVQLAGGYS